MAFRAASLILATMLIAGAPAVAEEATSGVFAGHGIVTAIQSGSGALTIRHDNIAGFMPAMEMMYKIKSPSLAKDLHPGDTIDFKIDAAKYVIVGVTLVSHSR